MKPVSHVVIYLQVDIACGTPGRLEDLISTGNMDLSQVRFFVLDEAVNNFYIFRSVDYLQY